jgi:hypothetical protein
VGTFLKVVFVDKNSLTSGPVRPRLEVSQLPSSTAIYGQVIRAAFLENFWLRFKQHRPTTRWFGGGALTLLDKYLELDAHP